MYFNKKYTLVAVLLFNIATSNTIKGFLKNHNSTQPNREQPQTTASNNNNQKKEVRLLIGIIYLILPITFSFKKSLLKELSTDTLSIYPKIMYTAVATDLAFRLAAVTLPIALLTSPRYKRQMNSSMDHISLLSVAAGLGLGIACKKIMVSHFVKQAFLCKTS